PTANAGGPYAIDEGSPLSLNASTSTDPNGGSLIYSWDLNGDGLFDDASGVTPTLTWEQLKGFGIGDDGTFQVSLKVVNDEGFLAFASTTLTVKNVPPTLNLSGATDVNEGLAYTLNLASSDPGSDTISEWTINWGDGVTETIGGNPTSVHHIYADGPNNFTIVATATDEDGTYQAAGLAVTVNNVTPAVTLSGPAATNEGTAY